MAIRNRSGHSVLAIANEFLRRGEEGARPLTQMHLQKLCYLAHGFDLALFQRPLTFDRIEAWDWGPVFPELYDALRRYGSRPISGLIHVNNWAQDPNVRGVVMTTRLDETETGLIDAVWNDYGSFEAFQLSALTHEADSPWAKVYVPGKRNIHIPNALIRDYFVGLTDGQGHAAA